MTRLTAFSSRSATQHDGSPAFLDALSRRLSSAHSRDELDSILKNSTGPALHDELLVFARRLASCDKTELSLDIYRWLAAEPGVSEEAKHRAEENMAVLLGKGSFGANAEMLLHRVASDSTDPRMIAPMLGATVIGRLGKLGALGQMWQGPAGILTRGRSARWIAEAFGFGLEGLSFTALSRPLAKSPPAPLGADLAKSFFGLGVLRFSHALGESLVGSGVLGHRALSELAPQASTLLGFWIARRIDGRDSQNALGESLAAMLGMQAGARLGFGLLGEDFLRWQRGLEIRVAALAAKTGSGSGFFNLPGNLGEPALAGATIGTGKLAGPETPIDYAPMQMSIFGGKGKKGQPLGEAGGQPLAPSSPYRDPQGLTQFLVAQSINHYKAVPHDEGDVKRAVSLTHPQNIFGLEYPKGTLLLEKQHDEIILVPPKDMNIVVCGDTITGHNRYHYSHQGELLSIELGANSDPLNIQPEFAQYQRIQNILFSRGDRVDFNTNGKIVSTRLSSSKRFEGKSYPEGATVYFDSNGRVTTSNVAQKAGSHELSPAEQILQDAKIRVATQQGIRFLTKNAMRQVQRSLDLVLGVSNQGIDRMFPSPEIPVVNLRRDRRTSSFHGRLSQPYTVARVTFPANSKVELKRDPTTGNFFVSAIQVREDTRIKEYLAAAGSEIGFDIAGNLAAVTLAEDVRIGERTLPRQTRIFLKPDGEIVEGIDLQLPAYAKRMAAATVGGIIGLQLWIALPPMLSSIGGLVLFASAIYGFLAQVRRKVYSDDLVNAKSALPARPDFPKLIEAAAEPQIRVAALKSKPALSDADTTPVPDGTEDEIAEAEAAEEENPQRSKRRRKED